MAHTGVGGDRVNKAEIPNGHGRRTCLRHIYRQVLLMSLIQVITEQFIQRPSLQSDSASRGGGGGAVAQIGLCIQHAVTKEPMTRVTSLGLKTLSVISPEQVSLSLVSAHLFQGCHRATLAQAP